jgi:formylmethanofuran dehydrogenase subunit A
MNVLGLVRDFGIPLALLIAAVVALWRAWLLERRMRERDLAERCQKLIVREDELYALYRELALRELVRLTSDRQEVLKDVHDERDSGS